MQYLIPGIFERKIRRGLLHTRSTELAALIDALKAYWDRPSREGIQQVASRLDTWQREHPKEFRARGRQIYADLISELEEEYSRWGLRSLGADIDAAVPFVVNPRTGKTVAPNRINPDFFYHATNFRNLKSIRRNGLDPRRGGRGGASDQVKSAHFKQRSAGKVHVSGATGTASFYTLLHDEPSLFVRAYGKGLFRNGVPADPVALGSTGVILRFPRNVVRPGKLERDPDDRQAERDAYRVYSRVPPSHIDVLTVEGWTPIGRLAELDAALGS